METSSGGAVRTGGRTVQNTAGMHWQQLIRDGRVPDSGLGFVGHAAIMLHVLEQLRDIRILPIHCLIAEKNISVLAVMPWENGATQRSVGTIADGIIVNTESSGVLYEFIN